MNRFTNKRMLVLLSAAALLLVAIGWDLWSGGSVAPSRQLMNPSEAARALEGDDEDAAWQAMIDQGRSGDRSTAPLVMRTLRSHASPRIRAAAANALGRLEVWDSMPTLLDALSDPDPLVRTQSNLAIAKLVGFQYTNYDPNGPVAERNRAIQIIRKDYPTRLKGHLDWLRRRGIDPNKEPSS